MEIPEREADKIQSFRNFVQLAEQHLLTVQHQSEDFKMKAREKFEEIYAALAELASMFSARSKIDASLMEQLKNLQKQLGIVEEREKARKVVQMKLAQQMKPLHQRHRLPAADLSTGSSSQLPISRHTGSRSSQSRSITKESREGIAKMPVKSNTGNCSNGSHVVMKSISKPLPEKLPYQKPVSSARTGSSIQRRSPYRPSHAATDQRRREIPGKQKVSRNDFSCKDSKVASYGLSTGPNRLLRTHHGSSSGQRRHHSPARHGSRSPPSSGRGFQPLKTSRVSPSAADTQSTERLPIFCQRSEDGMEKVNEKENIHMQFQSDGIEYVQLE